MAYVLRRLRRLFESPTSTQLIGIRHRTVHASARCQTVGSMKAGNWPLRVLVADDVDLNRDLLDAGLTHAGHRVTLVTNGAEALAAVTRQPFDVVVMDVEMPVMDGIEATRRIRQLPPPCGAIPIIALSARDMEAQQKECLDAGMSKFLSKPVAWPRLLSMLAALLQRGR